MVEVKRERKRNGVDGVFHSGPPFLFLLDWKEKRKENVLNKITELLSLFHLSYFKLIKA